MSRRHLLEDLYRAAVAAADPREATRRATAALDLSGRVGVLALGKGARAMAAGAVAALGATGADLAAGLVVSHDTAEDLPRELDHVTGDHPEPGHGSAQAARAIGVFCARASSVDDVVVLVSGGATSLCAAPVNGIPVAAMHQTFRVLLRSGAPITTINAIRRRILRWGAGRLAAALHPARVHCLIVSDVMGNDHHAIASGPCVPDPLRAVDVIALLQQRQLHAVPAEVTAYLRRAADGVEPETPKPGDAIFRSVEVSVLLDNGVAIAAARAAAQRRGIRAEVVTVPLAGEAAEQGRSMARGLIKRADSLGRETRLWLWGGEPTVTIEGDASGSGGRCQELALAFAGALHTAGAGELPITLLAAGTDGRDGPTDAAGAVVDAHTWSRIAAAGRDPARDLAAHDSHAALAAAGALFVTGATGTNVNDVVIAALG